MMKGTEAGVTNGFAGSKTDQMTSLKHIRREIIEFGRKSYLPYETIHEKFVENQIPIVSLVW